MNLPSSWSTRLKNLFPEKQTAAAGMQELKAQIAILKQDRQITDGQLASLRSQLAQREAQMLPLAEHNTRLQSINKELRDELLRRQTS